MDTKIIMKVISYDVKLLTLFVRLESEVFRVNNEVGEELKDEF